MESLGRTCFWVLEMQWWNGDDFAEVHMLRRSTGEKTAVSAGRICRVPGNGDREEGRAPAGAARLGMRLWGGGVRIGGQARRGT